MTVKDTHSIKYFRIEINICIYILFLKMNQWISQQNPKIYMHAYPKSEPYFLGSLEIKKMETQNSTFQWKYYKFFMQHFAGDIGDAQYRGRMVEKWKAILMMTHNLKDMWRFFGESKIKSRISKTRMARELLS